MGRRDKDNNRAKVWMSLFIAFIMISSVFGIIIGSQTSDIRVGKYKFSIQDNGMYQTKISDKKFNFYTLPTDAQTIPTDNSSIAKLKAASFILTTFDPKSNDSLPAIEVARYDFSQQLNGKIVYSGVIEQSELYASLPVFNCENATAQTPVIVFNISDDIGIVDAGNCIYLNGRGSDFLRLRDKVIYMWYGVI